MRDRQLPVNILKNFIETYRQCPCLWKINSKEYLNKCKKAEAYEQLLKIVKPIYPEADKNFVVKKIISLRTVFRRELKKINDSRRSGRGEDEIYKTNLWYFDLLLFTADQETPRSSFSNLEIKKKNTPHYENSTLWNPTQFIAKTTRTRDELMTTHRAKRRKIGEQKGRNDNIYTEKRDLLQAQKIYFQNEEKRADEKHKWEKEQAEIKLQILKLELQIKEQQLEKNK